MSTQIQIASSGGVPTGFKYNLSVQYSVSPVFPSAASGQAIFVFFCDAEGCYYAGLSISPTDANGLTAAGNMFQQLNLQPFTVFISETSYTTFDNIADPLSVGGAWRISSNQILGTDVSTLDGQVGYFNFGTSNPFRLADAGYSMAGNLNGTTIGVGTSYIGIGSSTANATETNRSVPVTVTQGNIVLGYVKTAGIMTGSMQLAIMINGVQVGTPYTIPAGSAATTYYFLSSAAIANNSPVSIRVIQSTATSSGILVFGWTIK